MESGEYSPLGTSQVFRSQARILAATNRDLARLVQEGLFRQDLYYRLAIFQIHLPPLRERREDIPELCYSILAHLGRVEPKEAISATGLEWLMEREWPGNIRELRNSLEHASLMSRSARIEREHFPEQHETSNEVRRRTSEGRSPNQLRAIVTKWMNDHLKDEQASGLYDRFLEEVEPLLIASALQATDGNQMAAAKLLGIHRSTLRERLKKNM
jgi:two-component system nitrogen regulation response regulator GlnG